MEVVLNEIKAQHAVHIEDHPQLAQEVRVRVEQAKCRLSSENETSIDVPLPNGKNSYQRTLKRGEFETLITGSGGADFEPDPQGPSRRRSHCRGHR